MFEYSSEQVHSHFENGKGRTRVQKVAIRGTKGKKTVEIRDKRGAVTHKSTKALTKKEMDCIRRCQFVPGLFKECDSCIKRQRLRVSRRK